MDTAFTHIPVLRDEVLEYLRPDRSPERPYLVYDGTLGGAGHARSLLASDPSVFLVGVDRDAWALEQARGLLADVEARTHLVHGVFSEVLENLATLPEELQSRFTDRYLDDGRFDDGVIRCDAMLVDLGVSSFQLDDAARGFSFRGEAPLDMRMDVTQDLSAQQVVNDYSPQQLKRVLQRGGLAALSFRAAKAIVDHRPITTTTELAAVCAKALRNAKSESTRHPATIVFQAIRIEVNDEFGEIERFLDAVPQFLAPGGSLAVISFHSSEDKLVASRMRAWSRATTPLRGLPMADQPALGKLLTAAAVTPSPQEVLTNPRSRSARLRVFKRSSSTHVN